MRKTSWGASRFQRTMGVLAIVLLAVGCAQRPPAEVPTAPSSSPVSSPPATSSPAVSGTGSPMTTATAAGDCPSITPSAPEGPAATVQVLAEKSDGTPKVSAAVYPRPDHPGNPWSQWGQGIVLPDGRFLSGMGDHLGIDGNSYVFVFEPETGKLTRFADVSAILSRPAGSYGYGKIHAQMVRVSCGEVVFGTYWGTRTGLTYGGPYTGDHLLSIHVATLRVRDLGVPVPGRGLPSLAGHDGLIYGEAVDPQGRPQGQKGDSGAFFVYDTRSQKVIYRSDDQRHLGFRNLAVDAAGRAFLAMADGGLLRYDPGGELSVHSARLPAGWLRASTSPARDGTVYAVTREPERYVAIRSDGRIDDLGPASGYVASMALAPAENEFYVVPDAHGVAWQRGTPLVAVDVKTGHEREVVRLGPLVQQRLGLVANGSYDVAVDRTTGRVFVGLNAGVGKDKPWGEVVLAVVEP